MQSPCNWVVTSQTTASTNRKGFGCKPSRCARCTTTTRRSAKLTNTTLASALISSMRSNNARTPAASECAVSKHERGICRVAASKQRATVQSTAAGCQAHSLREMRWHCRQRLPTPNASTLRRKTQHANGGCVRTRCLLQALYRGQSTAAPRATQVAAPTTPSLGKASNTQLNSLEALGFIDPPSARFVLPPSAPTRLHSLPQRHLLLLRLHGVQRLTGRHAPQRHQQRERRRHQHNRHLELGRVRRPLVDVGKDVVA